MGERRRRSMQGHTIRRRLPAVAALGSCLAMAGPVRAQLKTTAGEMENARLWSKVHLELGGAPPFSFSYGGKPSMEIVGSWKFTLTTARLDARRTRRIGTYRDPSSGLVLTCTSVTYRDYPTVEWTLVLKNEGSTNTPILEDIQALDTWFRRTRESEFLLHHWTGSPCAPNDYEPHATTLGPGVTKRITTSGGRSTNSDMPYFNLEWPGGGVLLAYGWPGQWAAEFSRDQVATLRVRGGQELTHLVLAPGEEIRTPLAVMQFYEGDWIRSQNLWRRWMVDHNLPRPGGKLLPPSLMMCTSDAYPGMKSDAAGEIAYAKAYLDAGVGLQYWWIDAGWYPCGDGWWNVGTWEPDPQRYPHGLREVADYVHKRGLKFVTWFEPERVAAGSKLAEEHPEWVLGGKAGGLLNLGNREARTWLTNHIDRVITEQGIDLYRQDFNMDPLEYWRKADAPDRQGITENHHVTGYLAYWDELRRRHPGMSIDSCASGGRRNDLETLRRAVPLLRSDYRFEPTGTQGHTYGISSWMPYYGTGVPDTSDYVVRSHWCPWLGIGRDSPRKPGIDWTTYHRYVAEWRQAAGLMMADYYPLTPYSLDNRQWIAWQFHDPAKGAGVVQAFRRPECADEAITVKLGGLAPSLRYALTNVDTHEVTRATGRALMTEGLVVRSSNRPAAVVFMVKRESR